ncbi:MAG: hypothetical protein ACFFAN_01510 [Promethearchaeota archaeon]
MSVNSKNKELAIYLDIMNHFETRKKRWKTSEVLKFLTNLLLTIESTQNLTLINNVLIFIETYVNHNNKGKDLKYLSEKERKQFKILLKQEFVSD